MLETSRKRKSEDRVHDDDKRKLTNFYAISSLKGERDNLEDCHACFEHFEVSDKLQGSYFSIFDGHNGVKAAEFCATSLHVEIKSRLADATSELVGRIMKRSMIDSYKACEDSFIKLANGTKPPLKDGTTAITVIKLDRVLYIANVGDTRAVLFRCKDPNSEKLSPIQLTVDHSPSVFEERQRIEKFGGVVKDGRVGGVIEVSRSIGDVPYKHLGLSCVPDVRKVTLTSQDHYLVIACDGLWKVIDNEQVAQFLNDNSDECLERMTSELCSKSVLRLSGDNVTVLIVNLKIST